VPVFVGLAWFELLASAATAVSFPVLLLGVLPALTLGAILAPTLLVLAMKWILLGRVRPGTHPLWSSWVCRWDFLYVVWDFCAAAALTALEGTLLLNAYLRAMGVRIGRQVVLGPGFVHVADPDMLEFEDHSTLSCGAQSHTFEDRVLKLDRVRVRRGATVGSGALLLYGADVGERASVMPHSVVMKRERLAADRCYAGFPTRPVGAERPPTQEPVGRPSTRGLLAGTP
jgi:non-ribosomal peptide synthetase-like protein